MESQTFPAFEQFYAESERRFRAAVRKRAPCFREVDDLFHEVWLTVLTKASRGDVFKTDREGFLAFFCGIARRKLLHAFQAQQRHLESLESVAAGRHCRARELAQQLAPCVIRQAQAPELGEVQGTFV